MFVFTLITLLVGGWRALVEATERKNNAELLGSFIYNSSVIFCLIYLLIKL